MWPYFNKQVQKDKNMFTLYLHTPACLTIKLESRCDCVIPAVHNQRLSKLTKILKCQAFDVLHNSKIDWIRA